MLGEKEELKKRLSDLRTREKQNAETMFNIGQMYMSELNDLMTAQTIFIDLYSIYPNNYEFMMATVQSFARANDVQTAINILKEWINLNPNAPEQAEQWLEILQGQA